MNQNQNPTKLNHKRKHNAPLPCSSSQSATANRSGALPMICREINGKRQTMVVVAVVVVAKEKDNGGGV
jgi:hypothetical protein